jgi:hypothetical protein
MSNLIDPDLNHFSSNNLEEMWYRKLEKEEKEIKKQQLKAKKKSSHIEEEGAMESGSDEVDSDEDEDNFTEEQLEKAVLNFGNRKSNKREPVISM